MNSVKEKARFIVDRLKCIKCSKCKNVCSGMVIDYDEDCYSEIKYARGTQKNRANKIHRYIKMTHQQSLFE